MTQMGTPEPTRRERRQRRHRGGFFFPLLLVGAGLVILLNNLGITNWNGWDIVTRGWPVLIIVMALDLAVNRNGILTPILLLSLGVAALLNTTGVWQWDMVTAATRFWPLLLIAMGVDVFLTRPVSVGELVGVLPGLLGIAVLAWFLGSLGSSNRVVDTRTISQPLGSATAATITLEPVAGRLRVRSLRDSGGLISGPVSLTRGERVGESLSTTGGRADYTLSSQGTFVAPAYMGSAEDQWYWDLQVTGAVPVDLDTSMVAGVTRIDLTGVEAESLKVETVFGQAEITLPREGTLDGRIDTVFGSTTIVVPTGMAVQLQVSEVAGDVKVPAGFQHQGDTYTSPDYASAANRANLVISQVAGAVTVQYEQG